MNSPVSELCLSVITLEVIIGLGSNAFIMFFLIFSGFKGTNTTPYNYILMALNVSSMCYMILMTVNLLVFFFGSSLNLTYIPSILNYLTFYSITSCSWLTAGLCFFYFIKILQFRSRFISWLKMKIDRIIPWLILIVEIASLFESFIASYIFHLELSGNSTIDATDMKSEHHKQRLKLIKVVLVVTSLPFLIAISTTAASAVSLKLHSHHMKVNTGHTNVKDYQSAVQTMACLVIFYAFIYLVMVLFEQELFADQSWGYWICLMILFSFSMVQSTFLINRNPKLKEAWIKLFTFF